jgi:hypothetical protein
MKINLKGLNCKVTIATILMVFVLGIANAQTHWELVAGPGNGWNYYNSFVEPDSSWKFCPDSNLVDWKPCNGIIESGNTLNDSILEPVPDMYSALLRKTFFIKDSSLIKAALFYADFSNGIVVWLNGQEICRSQELYGRKPNFVDSTSQWHPMYMRDGGLPERFAIDTSILRKAMRSGENVLSMQVCKITASFGVAVYPYFFAEIQSESIVYNDVTDWFVPSEIDSSSLPIIIINSNNNLI